MFKKVDNSINNIWVLSSINNDGELIKKIIPIKRNQD